MSTISISSEYTPKASLRPDWILIYFRIVDIEINT